jgi:hypothetical protein
MRICKECKFSVVGVRCEYVCTYGLARDLITGYFTEQGKLCRDLRSTTYDKCPLELNDNRPETPSLLLP